jgi:hypothetical protein
MEIQNKIGEQVFDKLRTKFKQVTLGDEEGNSTQNPSDAVFFNFNYVDNQGHDHGNITISLIDQTMKIYYSKNISSDLDGSELTEWYKFLQDMRKTAMSSLYQFDTHDISKANLDIADIQATVTRNSMNEGKMYGSTKSSYQECGPAKIIVRHNESINPEVRGSRSRKIESIFVETTEGERFKMPFNSVPGARAMAQHVGQGGRPYDDIGNSISTMVSEIASLRPFVARNRNAIYEDETTMEMVEAAKEYYAEARKTLSKLKGKRGYKAYAESFELQETIEADDDDMTSMKDRFTKKRFSDKMEAAMPTVHKAYNLKKGIPKKPAKPGIKPLEEFEQWVTEIEDVPEAITEDCAEILSDEEIQVIVQWIDGQITDLPEELEEKLIDHYADEMPYGALTGDDMLPSDWLFDKLDQEYGYQLGEAKEDNNPNLVFKKGQEVKIDPTHPRAGSSRDIWTVVKWAGRKGIIQNNRTGRKEEMDGQYLAHPEIGFMEAKEEICSEKCCGPKTVSECKCGPECPHCDCYAINEAVRQGRVAKGKGKPGIPHKNVNEVKSGPFNSKVIGRRAKVYGQPEFGDVKYNGEEGEIVGAEREHTFSAMVPFKVIYKLDMDDGNRIYIRRENVRPIKREVAEGTWAIPDTPDKQERLRELMANPLPFGQDGVTASQAVYDLLGDDELFDELYDAAKEFGPEADARPTIQSFLKSIMGSVNAERGTDFPVESLKEDEELTQSIMHQMIHKVMSEYPKSIRRNGMDYTYAVIEDAVSWVTDDWPEDQGFGSSDRGAIWRRIAQDLELEQGVEEARGRAPHERMKQGDIVLPKATYSDYLDVYKSSAVGGTDEEDDANRMVKALQKQGKSADHGAAKGALKRMAEQEAKTGLHMNESLAQLMRDAGITK